MKKSLSAMNELYKRINSKKNNIIGNSYWVNWKEFDGDEDIGIYDEDIHFIESIEFHVITDNAEEIILRVTEESPGYILDILDTTIEIWVKSVEKLLILIEMMFNIRYKYCESEL